MEVLIAIEHILIICGVLFTIGGGILAAVWKSAKNRHEFETNSKKDIEDLQKRLDRHTKRDEDMQEDVRVIRADLHELTRKVDVLVAQLETLGMLKAKATLE